MNPSHQIYFAGCNLRCGFCTVSEWNLDPEATGVLNVEAMQSAIARRRAQGARTLNLLGGEPTINIHGILRLLARVDPEAQVVLNSNMYYESFLNDWLDGLVDIYLADIKCMSRTCSRELLDADDYVDVVTANILRACQQADVIVRHVVLPGHRECCLEPTLRWVAEELPGVKLSLRGDYIPPASSDSVPMQYLESSVFKEATEEARKMGLKLIQ